MAEAQNQLIEDILSREDDRFKLVLVGDSGVGKTYFLLRWITNHCPGGGAHIRTIFDHYNCIIEHNEQRVCVSVWDTAGLDEYSSTRTASYNQTRLFLVCFSVISPLSFANVSEKWIPEIREHCPNTPIVLLGLKSDLRGQPELQEVSEESVLEAARDIGAVAYHEVSSQTGAGVQQTLQTIASRAQSL